MFNILRTKAQLPKGEWPVDIIHKVPSYRGRGMFGNLQGKSSARKRFGLKPWLLVFQHWGIWGCRLCTGSPAPWLLFAWTTSPCLFFGRLPMPVGLATVVICTLFQAGPTPTVGSLARCPWKACAFLWGFGGATGCQPRTQKRGMYGVYLQRL